MLSMSAICCGIVGCGWNSSCEGGSARGKRYFLRLGLLLLPVLVVGGGLSHIKNTIDNSETYSAGWRYNSARASMVDRQVKDWEDVEDQLEELGLSQNDYDVAKAMILADTDIVDTAFLNTVGSFSAETAENMFQNYLDYAILIRFQILFYWTPGLFWQTVLQLTLLLWYLFRGRDVLSKLVLVCCYLGAFVICSYYTYVGHLQDYLIQTIMLAIWCVWGGIVLTIPHKEPNDRMPDHMVELFLFGAVFVGLVGMYGYRTGIMQAICLQA